MRDNLRLGELVETPSSLEHQRVAQDELFDGALLGHVQDLEPVLVHWFETIRPLSRTGEVPGPDVEV